MDEDKQGIYASSALAGILVVLSVVLLGITGPGGMVGALTDNADEFSEEVSGGDGPSSDSSTDPPEESSDSGMVSESTVEPPSGLSFLCGDAVETETSSTESQLNTDQKNEAEKAAGEFVRTVYGYTGPDADAYEASVEEMTVEECFGESSAAEEVAAASEVARQGGEENAPSDRSFLEKFVGFYISGEETMESGSQKYQVVYGEAVWVSCQAGAEATTGQDTFNAYEESLTLAKKAGSEEDWKILEGQGAYDYTDGYYADAVDETIQELENNAEEPGGDTTTLESTDGLMEESTSGQ